MRTNLKYRFTHLPQTIPSYWKIRIWDRWMVENSESNKMCHINQRLLTIDEIDKLGGHLRVLDLCCGTGRITYDLISLKNIHEVVAVDINSKALNMLLDKNINHNSFKKLKVVQADIMKDPINNISNSFDVIVCIDALHHLWGVSSSFDIIFELLKPKGKFIGNFLSKERVLNHVINKRGYFQYYYQFIRAKIFQLCGFSTKIWEYAGYKGYVRLNTLTEKHLRKFLNEKYKVIKIVSDDYHWFLAEKSDLTNDL